LLDIVNGWSFFMTTITDLLLGNSWRKPFYCLALLEACTFSNLIPWPHQTSEEPRYWCTPCRNRVWGAYPPGTWWAMTPLKTVVSPLKITICGCLDKHLEWMGLCICIPKMSRVPPYGWVLAPILPSGNWSLQLEEAIQFTFSPPKFDGRSSLVWCIPKYCPALTTGSSSSASTFPSSMTNADRTLSE
jgi:hypothetical protein